MCRSHSYLCTQSWRACSVLPVLPVHKQGRKTFVAYVCCIELDQGSTGKAGVRSQANERVTWYVIYGLCILWHTVHMIYNMLQASWRPPDTNTICVKPRGPPNPPSIPELQHNVQLASCSYCSERPCPMFRDGTRHQECAPRNREFATSQWEIARCITNPWLRGMHFWSCCKQR